MTTVATVNPPICYRLNTIPHDFKFKQSPTYTGKIKIELWYETAFANHVASKVMKASAAYEGPFVESICVFMRPERTFDMIEAYWDIFEEIKDAGLIPKDAILEGFDVLLEDCLIQAWSEV